MKVISAPIFLRLTDFGQVLLKPGYDLTQFFDFLACSPELKLMTIWIIHSQNRGSPLTR